MAYQIKVHQGESQTRNLKPGENLIGSGQDCDIRVEHATVSRHHAVLVVGASGIQIADLQSSNGTSVDGQRIRQAVDIRGGVEIHFGTVAATLTELADDDIESIPIGSRDARKRIPVQGATKSQVTQPRTTPSPTTASVQPMQLLALVYLPRVADALVDGQGPIETARRFGSGLLAALPTQAVDIMSDSGSPLFQAGSDDARGDEPTLEVSGGSVNLSLFGGRVSDFEIVRPLLETGCTLVSVASNRQSVLLSKERTAAVWPEPRPIDPVMQEIYGRAAKVACSSIHVLIRGASGTGKEVLARFIHRVSERKNEAFQALNCAALPADLLEAELFGIERGVATGVDARPGHFERADGGTLFLDEIGDMASSTQAKILRVLQEGEVFRIGGGDPRPARVRVISATNRDLDLMLESGDFRSDLYYRIADWEVELPSLTARVIDIPNFAAYFLDRENRKNDRQICGLSKAALRALVRYEWPGNVRQLEREIGRAVLFAADGELLDSGCLSDTVRGATQEEPCTLREGVVVAERNLIKKALAESGGDVGMASEVLDVPLSTLYRKIKMHGLDFERD